MKRLQAFWDRVRTGIWLIPAAMIVIGAALAVLMLWLDAGLDPEDYARGWWLYAGDGEDARDLLGTLLTSVIAMASMVFSVTVVALTLAASQFGSRLVRLFRADIRTQLTLGAFVMTIVYLLLVYRMVRGQAEGADVPHVSVTIGSALALVSVLALLAFIQGLARSIVADEVVKRVARELDAAIPRLARAQEDTPAATSSPDESGPPTLRLALKQEGYVQAIDYAALVECGTRHDLLLRLDFRPGKFVVEDDRLVGVHARDACPETLADEVREAVVVGQERTPTQDIEFPIRHLVEIALRALSPSINDPFTALTVIDRLRGSLTRIMAVPLHPAIYRDSDGTVRVICGTSSFTGILDAAFNQIRQAAVTKPSVIIHMLEAVAGMCAHIRCEEHGVALGKHARMIAAAGLRHAAEPADRSDIEDRLRRIERALQGTW